MVETVNAIPDSFFESHPTFSSIIDRLRPMIVSSDTSQDLGDRIYKQAISLLGQQTLSDSLYSHDTESPPEALSPEESVSEMINDVTEEEPFASARSSFSSDADVGVLPEEPAKVPAQPPATREVGFPPVLHPLMTDRVCYIEFSKRKEESSATHSSVVFHFAVVREERFTYIGWFSSLSPISGYGFSFNSDGSYYMGEFRKGKKNGFGQFFYDNGSHYDGYWENNQKQGSGRFYFNDNLFYSGRWNENRMIDCKLEYSPGLCSDISCICNFLSTHNDYIFFKQAQLVLNDIDMNMLYSLLNTSSRFMFFSKSFNLIEEMNVTATDAATDDLSGPLSKLLALLPSFPCLKYVSLANLAIQTLEVADHSLNNLLIFYIINCPQLQTIKIGNDCLRNVDTLRISDLPKLTTLSIGDDSFNDSESQLDNGLAYYQELNSRYKNKSLVLNSLASLFSIHFGRNCCTSIYSFYLNALPTLSVLYFGSRAFRSTQIFTLTSGAFAS